jgi:cardiolipin synthase
MPWTSPWEEERVVEDGDAWFAGLATAIAGARERIDLESFIVRDDPAVRPVLEALAAAAARGVAVRMLVDGLGSAEWLANLAARPDLVDRPVELRVWHPLPWAVRRLARHQPAGWDERWRWLRGINRRNHRKLCLIDAGTDRAEAWVGSFNLDGRHAVSQAGVDAWRDCGAMVRGRPVAVLAEAFERAWTPSWRMAAGRLVRRLPALPRRIDPRSAEAVRLNHGLRQRRAAYRDLLARIRAARGRIWVMNAYWLPKGSLLRALAAAARRGVDVRVLTPAVSDHPITVWAALALHDGLIRAGVRVAAFPQRMLHAKTVLFDDHALVGSHNLNHRSLIHDLEVEVVLRHPASLDRLAASYAADWTAAAPVTTPVWAGRPAWQRWMARVGLWIKRWL